MYGHAGRLDDARALFEEFAVDDFAAVVFDRNWTSTMTLLADACALLRDVRRAGILYEMMRPYQNLCVVTSSSCIAMLYGGSLERPLGGLATTMSQWPEAERHYEAAIAMDQRMRATPFVAEARLGYARMLSLRAEPGDRDRALVLLGEALAVAERIGMAGVAADGRALLGQLTAS